MKRSNWIGSACCEVLLSIPTRSRKQEFNKAKETFLESFPEVSKRARAVYIGYPANYRVGMSNLGFHFVFGSIARRGVMRVERFFADTSPLTFETGAHISGAFALLFSISYEEDYLNLVRILTKAGIEPLREKRKCRPLIIVGGPAPSSNPFPIADIVDAVALGEGENKIDELASVLEDFSGKNRSGITGILASIPGMFVPSITGSEAVISHGEYKGPFPHTVILTPDTVFSDTLLVETGRGCTGSCAFCMATSLYRPYRPATIESISDLLLKSAEKTGKVGLVSTAVTSHPYFYEIVDMLLRNDLDVRFSSLKAEDIDDRKAWLISRTGTRSVSIAPESGSEEIRFRLGKRVRNDVYIDAVRNLVKNGIVNIGLYLLIGCPGESEKSIDETRHFLARIKEAASGARVSVHINVLVPKPWTPLQFYAMPVERELVLSLKSILAVCRGLGLKPEAKSVRSSIRQAQLSMGGVLFGQAIIDYCLGGISWKKAIRNNGIDPAYIHVERGTTEPLSWDILHGPFEKKGLLDRYRRITQPGQRLV